MGKIAEILHFLYPWTLILVTILFIIWHVLKRNNKKFLWLNILIVVSLILYFLSFFFNYGLQVFMIFWFLRDALLFYITYLIVKTVIRYKIIAIIIGVLVVGALVFWYFKYDKLPLSSEKITTFDSDKSAELLVVIKSKSLLTKLNSVLTDYDPIITQAFPQVQDTAITKLDDYYTINLGNMIDSLEIIELLESSGLVDDVEFNEIYSLSPIESIPSNVALTPKYSDTLLNDPWIREMWAFNYMKINNLMPMLTSLYPVKKAKIFILDTGIEAVHEDLASNYLSLSEKYDTDTDIHGTHCAGIACAVSNNNLGIASLNLTGNYTTVTSITVLPGGSGRQESIIDGIILAADNGADVISMSLGGTSADRKQKAYERAIKYANDKGAIVIVAAGNENISAKQVVPASCKGVITVAAVDHQLQKASFSNDVSEIEYKICAPGVNILSTVPGNEYKFLNGTSMATPYVAGLAGIMKALQPDLTTEQLYQILQSTGIETRNRYTTGKFIQAFEAVKSLEKAGFKTTALRYFSKISSFRKEKVKE